MALLEQVREDANAALKAGDRARVDALRMITAALQRASKDAAGGEVDEIEVLQRERKRRLESAAAYRDGGREELAESEEREAELIGTYLPEQISSGELEEIVDRAIAEVGAESPRDMGRVIGKVMPQVKGRADGGRVSAAVKAKLAP